MSARGAMAVYRHPYCWRALWWRFWELLTPRWTLPCRHCGDPTPTSDDDWGRPTCEVCWVDLYGGAK